MPKPIWNGHITFGLVNIPVTLFSGEKRFDLQFHLLDSRDKARIRYERVNETTGEEVPWSEIVQGYEFDDGNYVVLKEEDFKAAAVEATQTVEIEDFIDRKEIGLPYLEKPYYLVPSKKGEKAYVLLREVLNRTGKVGVAKVVIRKRQYLCAVIAEGDALILEVMRFQQELRDASEFDLPSGGIREYKLSAKEVELAENLVTAMTSKWKPEKYHDEYRDALMKWIEKKAKTGKGAVAAKIDKESTKESAEVIDIMDLLKKSVGKTRGKAQKPAAPARTKARAKPAARERKTASGRRQ